MASILLSDPVLQWLEPKDLQVLRALNRQHKNTIDEHRRTQTNYTVTMKTSLRWHVREELYARHPNVQALTFECGGPDSLATYLRPTLQSLHLRVPLSLETDPEVSGSLFWRDADDIARELQALETFLQRTPEAQLHTLRISFHPTVYLTLTNDRSMVVEYDHDGPIYEDYDVTLQDSYGSPEIYFSVIEKTFEMESVGEVLARLCSVRPCKSISLPYEFPGATTIPQATLSKPCENDSDAVESLWEHIGELRYYQQN